MKTISIRIMTGLFATAVVLTVIHIYGAEGLRLLALAAAFLGIREGGRILFSDGPFKFFRYAFTIVTIALLSIGVFRYELFGVAAALIFIAFSLFLVVFHRRFATLEQVGHFQARTALGLFYLAVLPTFAFKLFALQDGLIWFIFLLVLVFIGDTMAYFTGLKFGQTLLAPAISPKKTVEGAIGGLCGSLISGSLFHLSLPQISLPGLMGLAIMAGAVGQVGDLFESLLKRNANQKDSGTLMPGHGGVLDRIDGVLFAGPLVYFGASLLEKLS